MKKIFLSLLVLAATMNVLAVNMTAKVKIKVVSDNYTTENAPMVLGEIENLGTEVYSSSAEIYLNENPAMAMYAMYNSKKYQKLYTGTLGEMPLGIKCAEANNKLVVMEQSGTKLYLKDLQENVVTELSAGAEYSFSLEAGKVGTYIEDRFQLYVAPTKDYTRDAATIIGNWYTICVPGGVDATEYASVMDVYTVAGYNAEFGFGVDPMTGAMQPGVPYIFQAKATQIAFNYNEEVAASDPQPGTNYLTGTFVETTTPAVAYVVANNKLNWAAEGTAVPANRAYLNYADITDGNFPVVNPLLPAPGRKFLPAPKAMPTDLDGAAINGLQNGKFIMNGRFMIVKDGKSINVLGL